MKLLSSLIFTLAILCINPAQAEAPDFGLKTLDGKSYSLDNVIGKGKWVLLMFWATDCQICKIQEPLNSAFHESHVDLDAEVVGIAIDGMERSNLVKDYLDKHDLSYPNYIADIGMVAFNYQALTGEAFRGTPTHVLFSPEGKFMAVAPGMLRIQALEEYIQKHSSG